MLVTQGETYRFERYPRIPNSPYEFDDVPDIYFKGRPANQVEVKSYRIQQGVNGSTDSVFVYCSNLPSEIRPEDRIKFMGKIWTVKSIGYYYDSTRVVNNGVMSEDYLASRCPKGMNLQ